MPDTDFKLEKKSIEILREALNKMEEGFSALPEHSITQINKSGEEILIELAKKMQDNYPYFHPMYAGQMMYPPHPIARAAYMLSLWINPNNHALDGGRATSQMEKEAVAEIAKVFGWNTHLGHLTGGGTMANLEALWIAGEQHPGKLIVASEQAHYTHTRLSSVLKLNFKSIPVDKNGVMDITQLEKILNENEVGTVIATIGTTAAGAIDPLPEIIELQDKYKFRIHADAAYGGYFILSDKLSDAAKKKFEMLHRVDSIVIDPHKHGMQPYGCGCILFRDPSVGRFYKHDSPYTYFSSSEMHLGEISLECSRPGAAAAALWATMKLLPPQRSSEFSGMLDKSRMAALKLYNMLKQDSRFIPGFMPELDIVTWIPAGSSISESSKLSRLIFDESAKLGLHLALAELPIKFFDVPSTGMVVDNETVTCLRSVLMKPEHLEWVDRIWEVLVKAEGIARRSL